MQLDSSSSAEHCGICFMLEKFLKFEIIKYFNKDIDKIVDKFLQRFTSYSNFLPRSENSNSQSNYNESAMANDSAINYQNTLVDNLDEPTLIFLSVRHHQ